MMVPSHQAELCTQFTPHYQSLSDISSLLGITCIMQEWQFSEWVIQRLSKKFMASYIKKHSTTTVTNLFFDIISTNFNAFVLSFLQLLYSCLIVKFILPLKKFSTDSLTSLSLEKYVLLKCSLAMGTNRSRRVIELDCSNKIFNHIQQPSQQ